MSQTLATIAALLNIVATVLNLLAARKLTKVEAKIKSLLDQRRNAGSSEVVK